MRVAICGPSGIGKTTLARDIAEKLGIEYISGSLYDLMPNLPKNHFDLNQKYDANQKHDKNVQALNLRRNQYKGIECDFVTDRSIYDTLGYEIQENSLYIEACDIDDLIELGNLTQYNLGRMGITHLIIIPFEYTQFHNWGIEDDGKRITSPYFQSLVSFCQKFAIGLLGLKYSWQNKLRNLFQKDKEAELVIHEPNWFVSNGPKAQVVDTIPVLILNNMDHQKRMGSILNFLQ